MNSLVAVMVLTTVVENVEYYRIVYKEITCMYPLSPNLWYMTCYVFENLSLELTFSRVTLGKMTKNWNTSFHICKLSRKKFEHQNYQDFIQIGTFASPRLIQIPSIFFLLRWNWHSCSTLNPLSTLMMTPEGWMILFENTFCSNGPELLVDWQMQ